VPIERRTAGSRSVTATTDPRAALVVPDVDGGGLLVLLGNETMDWEARAGGAERQWRVKVERGYRRAPAALSG
jgi:hypothetical protein